MLSRTVPRRILVPPRFWHTPKKGIDGPPETGHLICHGQPFGLRPVFL
jgi:hypothetical protein